jgi:hypothetical protein
MTDPVNLVPKPKATEIARESIKAILKQTMEEAERGDLKCVMMVVVDPSGKWTPRISSTDDFSGMMGKLLIAQHEWVADYLKQESER